MVSKVNAAAWSSIWSIGGASATPHGFFLVENRNHANNHPTPRLSKHIVMQASQRHCSMEYVRHDTFKYMHNTNTYMIIHTNMHFPTLSYFFQLSHTLAIF